MLTWLGFLCLVLPGIYLLIAWGFTLPLVVDKQLDFWSAMELSRKVISRHWFKFLGFGLVLFLLLFAGALSLIVGVFVMLPLVLAAQMYAYEDIFGSATGAASVATGPSGTVVTPAAAPQPARAGAGSWSLATKIGLAAAALVIGGFLLVTLLAPHKPWGYLLRHLNRLSPQAVAVTPLPPATLPPPAALATPVTLEVFGPVTEQELTNYQALGLASGQTGALPQFVISRGGPERDAAACAWMEGAGMDFANAGETGALYSMNRDVIVLPRNRWDDLSPAATAALLHDSGQDVGSTWADGGLTNTFGFKTRTGSIGLLQLVEIIAAPPAVKIRYKLAQ